MPLEKTIPSTHVVTFAEYRERIAERQRQAIDRNLVLDAWFAGYYLGSETQEGVLVLSKDTLSVLVEERSDARYSIAVFWSDRCVLRARAEFGYHTNYTLGSEAVEMGFFYRAEHIRAYLPNEIWEALLATYAREGRQRYHEEMPQEATISYARDLEEHWGIIISAQAA